MNSSNYASPVTSEVTQEETVLERESTEIIRKDFFQGEKKVSFSVNSYMITVLPLT